MQPKKTFCLKNLKQFLGFFKSQLKILLKEKIAEIKIIAKKIFLKL